MFHICTTTLITFLFVLSTLAHGQTAHVSAIKIKGAGIFEYTFNSRVIDATSSDKDFKVIPSNLRISQQTNRIPIKPGLAYGVHYTIEGEPDNAMADIEILQRSSKPCILRDGSVAHLSLRRLRIQIGNQQYSGWVFPKPGEEDTCVNGYEPALNTIELLYEGRMLADQQFETFRE